MSGVLKENKIFDIEKITKKHLPIIIASAHDDAENIREFKEAGADGYIGKPINITKLQQEIKKLF